MEFKKNRKCNIIINMNMEKFGPDIIDSTKRANSDYLRNLASETDRELYDKFVAWQDEAMKAHFHAQETGDLDFAITIWDQGIKLYKEAKQNERARSLRKKIVQILSHLRITVREYGAQRVDTSAVEHFMKEIAFEEEEEKADIEED